MSAAKTADSAAATVESYMRPCLERLMQVAIDISSEEARRVADFLLNWYDADAYGGFNVTTAQECGPSTRHDMLVLFSWVIGAPGLCPVALGYGEQFKQIARIWRPQVNEPRRATA